MSPLKPCQMRPHVRSASEYLEGSLALTHIAESLFLQALSGDDHKARRIAYWQLFCINNTLGIPTETMQALGIREVHEDESEATAEGGAQ